MHTKLRTIHVSYMWKAQNDALVSQKLTCEIRSILNSLPLSREKFKCLDFFKELVPVEVISSYK